MQRLAAQIEEAVGQADILGIIRLAEHRQRQFACLRQHFHLARENLDLAGRQVRIHGVVAARLDLTVDAHDPFTAHFLGDGETGRIGIGDHLGDAEMVAKVDEENAAMIAHAVDPSGYADDRSCVRLAEGSACVAAVTVHVYSPLSAGRIRTRRVYFDAGNRAEKRTGEAICQGDPGCDLVAFDSLAALPHPLPRRNAMGLSIPARQVAKLHAVVRTLNDPAPLGELRERLGYRLLELFEADYFASFVHNGLTGSDDDAIAINMSADNIGAYEAYYQFHDPITSRMRKAGKAVHVNDVMEQSALERTEFFNDFLSTDGLTHGMNFHACLPRHQGGTHLGDLRIWRSRPSGNFDRVDVQMLQIVGELFAERAARAWRRKIRTKPVDPRFVTRHRLTARETDVLTELCRGKRDQDIADSLGISPETVRSHLKSLFQKTGFKGRTAVVGACMATTDTALPENGDAEM